MGHRPTKFSARLLCGSAVATWAMLSGAAFAQGGEPINIAPQPLSSALREFASQSQQAILVAPDLANAKVSQGVSNTADPETALTQLLAGTGLTFRRSGEALLIVQQEGGSGPQGAGAEGGGNAVEALIVTAQKREENIQDVPIAILAFSQRDLDEQKIEGGFDLLKAIPNVTFSKSNFSSYNFSIRGVGTKAISATTDPGVSVSFNNTGLIQNRLFEQEYFDIERVEVLRGPQGTLYGRNATSGVINVISAKPDLGEFDGFIKGEVGNYDSKRIQAMVNVPLIEDKLAVRLAGAMTDRQGYDFNSVTGNPVNGRDLWSARLTIGFEPTERFRGNFIWERFEEDDDRSRTGKQLCHRDPGLDDVGGVSPIGTHEDPNAETVVLRQALFSQGCKPGNLYDDAAFGMPNGLSLPFVFGMLALGGDCGVGCSAFAELGRDPVTNRRKTLIQVRDPYDGMMQSRDLRTIASFRDPVYRAQADVFELNLEFDVTDALTLYSQTAYNEDEVYSFQDFNRFNTVPIFTDTSQLMRVATHEQNLPSIYRNVAPGGLFCDPQLGCSNTMAGFDISQAVGEQFSQEFRLQSSYDGPFNFSVGANYTKFDTLIDYYVFYNLLTAIALTRPFYVPQEEFTLEEAYAICPTSGYFADWLYPSLGPVERGDRLGTCPYIDPNPIESINGEGHNYFRSKNPYELESHAVFGELYWNVRDDLNLTAGLRYTRDRKKFIPVPSQVLTARSMFAGGTLARGYPELPAIRQKWGEYTGKLGVDWKPDLAFTDETMLYASYSRGYKGGGANPPSPGFATPDQTREILVEEGFPAEFYELGIQLGAFPILQLTAVEYGPTFEPEFVDAFEVGAKNTILGGAATVNVGAFFYDYKDYQVSQIRDRTAVNENFDAKLWGLEFEGRFSPSRDLQFIANIGYLDTEIADGETSIDIMNRTQGDDRFVLVKPWVQLPSNCIAPVGVARNYLLDNGRLNGWFEICGGYGGPIGQGPAPTDPATGQPYDYRDYPEIHGGAGIRDELGGNELPNSPHWTVNLGAQRGMDILEGWRATVRADAYWQSQSWHRVYNADPYDKLHGWYNVNLSIWFERPDDGLKIELYAKNLLDKTPITDAFLNSDDTALTTNVFVLDPRLIGLSIKKEF